MPKLKASTIMPTTEEDEALTKAALSDPDAQPLAAKDMVKSKATRGRPVGSVQDNTKSPVTMRIDDDVLEAYRATGKGWQTRVNAVLRENMPTKGRHTSTHSLLEQVVKGAATPSIDALSTLLLASLHQSVLNKASTESQLDVQKAMLAEMKKYLKLHATDKPLSV